jgi:hypothetical protein
MKPRDLFDRLKLEMGFWLGFRAAHNWTDERETFDRLKGCASVHDLARLYLATAEPYRVMPARQAWQRFRHEAFSCHLWRSDHPHSAPTWIEMLRAAISLEGGIDR